jgi:hypothetical protein
MWCVPNLTETFIERMEDILNLYALPYNPQEPVICLDEKSRQLVSDTRPTQQTKPEKPRRRDYEYTRHGSSNIFVTVEPRGGYREILPTERRTKSDFAHEIQRIVSIPRYENAQKIHIVLDNLNTYTTKSLYDTFDTEEADALCAKIQFHYTPTHALWLNMAEIEIGVLDRCYLGKRVPDRDTLSTRAAHCMKERNAKGATIDWTFTVKKAQEKFKYGGAKLS